MSILRFARRYSDGSYDVSTEGMSEERARKSLLGSSDDDDTELVEVRLEIVRTLHCKLKLMRPADDAQVRTLAQGMCCHVRKREEGHECLCDRNGDLSGHCDAVARYGDLARAGLLALQEPA